MQGKSERVGVVVSEAGRPASGDLGLDSASRFRLAGIAADVAPFWRYDEASIESDIDQRRTGSCRSDGWTEAW